MNIAQKSSCSNQSPNDVPQNSTNKSVVQSAPNKPSNSDCKVQSPLSVKVEYLQKKKCVGRKPSLISIDQLIKDGAKVS